MRKKKVCIKEIIIDYIKKNKYDGLCAEYCGCGLEDLFPCEEPKPDCQPAYERTCHKCGTTVYSPIEYERVYCMEHEKNNY